MLTFFLPPLFFFFFSNTHMRSWIPGDWMTVYPCEWCIISGGFWNDSRRCLIFAYVKQSFTPDLQAAAFKVYNFSTFILLWVRHNNFVFILPENCETLSAFKLLPSYLIQAVFWSDTDNRTFCMMSLSPGGRINCYFYYSRVILCPNRPPLLLLNFDITFCFDRFSDHGVWLPFEFYVSQ